MNNILSRIERFLKRSGMKPSRFGRRYFRDPNFVFDLRAGKRLITPETRKRIHGICRKRSKS